MRIFLAVMNQRHFQDTADDNNVILITIPGEITYSVRDFGLVVISLCH